MRLSWHCQGRNQPHIDGTMTDKFRKLNDYQHARLRVEMYLGSREFFTIKSISYEDGIHVREYQLVPACFVAFREILDNAVDEVAIHGHGKQIKVDYYPETGVFSVEDDGRGIPIHEIPELGSGPAASILLSTPRAGRNFEDRGNAIGVNGLGAAIANFVSEWFKVEIRRDGQVFQQEWHEGTYRGKEVHRASSPKITKGRSKKTGTKIELKLSSKVFQDTTVDPAFIRDRMIDLAIAYPDKKFIFNGETLSGKLLSYGNVTKESSIEWGRGHGYVVLITSDHEGVFHHAIVNGIPMLNGGPHVSNLVNTSSNFISEALNRKARTSLGLKKSGNYVNKADLGGLIVYSQFFISDAQFDGQMKGRISTNISRNASMAVTDDLVKDFLKKNQEWVSIVIERVKDRVGKKDLEKAKKELEKKDLFIPSLTDATGKNRQDCILFIAEGLSAISGMLEVRDPAVHGGIGLFGKILNVHGLPPKKVLENKTVQDILLSLGLMIGEKADRSKLRYGKVFILSDQDEDGNNIFALLVNLFYRFWPELFQDKENPFIYKFITPLFILEKGNQRKYIYNDEKFDPADYKGWTISRAKGLGRLTKKDWEYVLREPKLIPLVDDGNLKEVLDLVFDPRRADDRKDWLINAEIISEEV
ncbi:MAG: hypothetical protein D6698_12430 [Gammaproteobacteria bacterium]|nr:MAG: hypothetical protein D6698_12430 [Gammaproteobacteria bacterium]